MVPAATGSSRLNPTAPNPAPTVKEGNKVDPDALKEDAQKGLRLRFHAKDKGDNPAQEPLSAPPLSKGLYKNFGNPN